MDVWRPYRNAKNCDLWIFWDISLRKPFFPDENRKIQSPKNLTNDASETFVNELFTLDRERNEQLINYYIGQKQINMTWPQWLTWANHQSCFIQTFWLWTGSAFVEKYNRHKRQTGETFFGKIVLLWLFCQ